MKPSGIGGQAVMEGVMMKNQSEYAVAVRREDRSIVVKKEEYHSISEKFAFFKVPFIRGIINFIESLYLGMKTLTYSASFLEEDEIREREEWKEWMRTGTGADFTEKRTKKKSRWIAGFQNAIRKLGLFFLILCSFVIAIALFMLLPMFLSEKFMGVEMSTGKAALEGGLRLLIFFLYLFLASQMEDMKRVFMYHGAEHKTINCIEHGLDLTVENVRGQSRQHKRCGTSFLFLVMFLSIIFFIFIRTEILWQKIVFRILLVPVIASISYEFIRLAGRSENPIITFFSKPGMWFQNLTTREPEDDMIEVAIQAVEAVFDWREFLKEEGVKPTLSMITKERLYRTISKEKASYKEKKEKEENKEEKEHETVTEEILYKRELPTEHIIDEELNSEEEDAILKALDKYFGE